MKKPKIYIAGPHVFFPEHYQEQFYDLVKELEDKYNFTAIVPKDGDVTEEEDVPLSMSIWVKNVEHMLNCDIIVADITPFRGVSGDAGTLFEVGFCAGVDKTIAMWSNASSTSYRNRAERYAEDFGEYYGFPWMECSKEDFGLTENLMLQPCKEVVIHSYLEAAIKDGIERYKVQHDY